MKRKIIISLVFMFITAVTVCAQSNFTEEQKKEFKERNDAYKAKLNLNEEQSTKMDEINTAYLKELSALKQSSGSKMQKYRQLKSVNNERDEKVKKILTKEQYAIYKQQQQERKEAYKDARQRQ